MVMTQSTVKQFAVLFYFICSPTRAGQKPSFGSGSLKTESKTTQWPDLCFRPEKQKSG
jgi:hypothetical protein